MMPIPLFYLLPKGNISKKNKMQCPLNLQNLCKFMILENQQMVSIVLFCIHTIFNITSNENATWVSHRLTNLFLVVTNFR
jgi:hypothetical protein